MVIDSEKKRSILDGSSAILSLYRRPPVPGSSSVLRMERPGCEESVWIIRKRGSEAEEHSNMASFCIVECVSEIEPKAMRDGVICKCSGVVQDTSMTAAPPGPLWSV